MTLTYLPSVQTELCLSAGAFDFEASDSFTRDDATDTLGSATSGQPWINAQGVAGVSSNQAYFSTAGNTAGTIGIAVLRCIAGGDLQVTIPTFSVSASLVFRYQDASNYWRLQGAAGGSYTLRRTVAGVTTTVDTYASAPVNGDTLKVRLSGSSITGYVNGTQRLSATDSTFQYAQFAGIAGTSTSERFDDFSASFVWTVLGQNAWGESLVIGTPEIQRGRQHELDQMETGTATVVFNNRDRRFDPGYTASPYYPFLLPYRRVRITASWNGVSYPLFVGHIEGWPVDYNRTATDGQVEIVARDRLAVIGAGFWSDYPGTVAGMAPYAYWRMGAA